MTLSRIIPAGRLPFIDTLRGVAIVAMISYHAAWDLDYFAFVDWNVNTHPAWRAFSASIAGAFLGLAGISLVLAHGEKLRWRLFWRRLGILALSALGVTLATAFFTPDGTVYFGILHAIALFSVLALLFLRLPWFVAAIAAVLCLLAPRYLASDIFNGPGWMWLGLGTIPPRTNDYEPLLPWFGPLLAGIALARALPLHAWLADTGGSAWLTFAGRHSLLIYLLHQPLLFGGAMLAADVLAPGAFNDGVFLQNCVSLCEKNGGATETCRIRCTCVSEEAQLAGLMTPILRNALDADGRARFEAIVQICGRR